MINAEIVNGIIERALSPISQIMRDRGVTEIMVTADGRVWVERQGVIDKTELVLPEADRRIALTAVAKARGVNGTGIDLIAGGKDAVVSAAVGGLRFAGAMGGGDSRGCDRCRSPWHDVHDPKALGVAGAPDQGCIDRMGVPPARSSRPAHAPD